MNVHINKKFENVSFFTNFFLEQVVVTKPQVNHDIVCEMRHRDELHERAIKLNDDNLFNKYRKTHNRVTQKIRNNKKKCYTDKIINRNICNSSNQELWKSVRSLIGNGKSTHGLPKDITCSDLNDHFTSVLLPSVNHPIKKTFIGVGQAVCILLSLPV